MAVRGALALAELAEVSVSIEVLVGGGDSKAEKEAGTPVGVTAPVAVAALVGELVVEWLMLPAVGNALGETLALAHPLGEALALARPLAEWGGLHVVASEAVFGLLETDIVAAEALGLPECDALPLSCEAEGVALINADTEAAEVGEALRVCGEAVALRENAREGVA